MKIKEFYHDKEMRNDVYKYFMTFLEMKAVEKVFEREETIAIAEAKDMIDGAFEQMDAEFAPKPKKRDLNNAI